MEKARSRKTHPIYSTEIVLLAALLCFAIFMRLWMMWDWPVNVDEAGHTNLARQVIEGKRTFYEPLAAYQGPVLEYLLIPSILFFGNNILFLRLVIVIASILSMCTLYVLTKNYYNKTTALLAVLFLSIIPTDIVNSSQVYEDPVVTFLIILAFYMFQKFSRTKNLKYIYFFSLIAGIALATSLLIVFLLIALLATINLNPLMKYDELRRKLNLKQFLVIISCILIGSFPFTYWNLITNFETVRFISNNFPVTFANINLLDAKTNIIHGYSDFISSLRNGIRWIFEIRTNSFSLELIFIASLIAFASIPIMIFHKTKKNGQLRKNMYILSIFTIMLMLKFTLTPSEFMTEGFVILYPFVAIIIAWPISLLSELKQPQKNALILILIFLVSYHVISFLSKVPDTIQNWQTHPCLKIGSELSKYVAQKNYSLLIIDTSHYANYFSFYSPLIETHYLVYKFNIIESFDRYYPSTWNESSNIFLNKSNRTDSCNSDWSRIRNITYEFTSFLHANNKTLVLEEEVPTEKNESLFKVFRIN